MSSSKDYLEYILDQLSGLDDISYRAMMGEYIIYYCGKVVGGIYDDRFLVKPVKAAVTMMPDAELELPYEGAKEMLLDFCIGRAAASIKEFYILPVGDKLIKYDTLAVNTIVKNKDGEISSCDIRQIDLLDNFNTEYLKYTRQVAENCSDRDLSEESMVIGTSAIIDTEIDGAVGMNSGIFNNPFIIWGKYRRKYFRYYLPVSFQFHHTQMDGAHAGKFLANLQNEINRIQ